MLSHSSCMHGARNRDINVRMVPTRCKAKMSVKRIEPSDEEKAAIYPEAELQEKIEELKNESLRWAGRFQYFIYFAMSELERKKSAAAETPQEAANNRKDGSRENEKDDENRSSKVAKRPRRLRTASVMPGPSATSSAADQDSGERVRIRIYSGNPPLESSTNMPMPRRELRAATAEPVDQISTVSNNFVQRPSSANGDVGSTARRLPPLPPLTSYNQHEPNTEVIVDSLLAASRMQSQMMTQYALPPNQGVASHSNHGFAPMTSAVMQSTSSNTVGPSSVHAATVPPSYLGLENWFYQPRAAGSATQLAGHQYNMHSQYGAGPAGIDVSTLMPTDWFSSLNATNLNTTTGYNQLPTSSAPNSAIADDHNSLPYPQYYAVMAAAAAATVAQQQQQEQQTANECITQAPQVVSTKVTPPGILVIDPRDRKVKREKLPPLRSPSGTVIKRPRGRPRKPRPGERSTADELLSQISEEQMDDQLGELERSEQMQRQIAANVITVKQEIIDSLSDGIDMTGGFAVNRQEVGSNGSFHPAQPQSSSRTPTPAAETNNNNNEDEREKTRVKRPRIKAGTNLTCVNCGTNNTTLWRRNENNVMECNACSLYFRKNNRHRPLALVKDTIMRRNRVSSKKPSLNAAQRQRQQQQQSMMQSRVRQVPVPNAQVDVTPQMLLVGGQQMQLGAAQLQQQPQAGAMAQYINYLMANRQELLGAAIQQQQQQQPQQLLIPKVERSLSGINAAALVNTPQTHFLQTHFERYGQDVGCSYVVPSTAGGVVPPSSSASAMPSYCQMSLPQLTPTIAFIDGRPNSI